MERKLKVGIVGCGGHMFEFLYNALKWAPPVDVVSVCDIDTAKLDRFTSFYNIPKRYTDYKEMFEREGLDAAICVVNESTHYEVAKAAMKAGTNIFVEKTPTATTAQAEELTRIQRDTGKVTMVGFNRRYMTSYLLAREITQRPEFGSIHLYQSQFHASPYRSEAYFKINHIIHHLDLARFLMGEIHLTHVERKALDDRMVAFAISFKSENGAIGTIHSASLLDELYPMERLELLGSRRNIVVDNAKGIVYNRPPGERKELYKPYRLVEGGDALEWNPSHGTYPRYSHHGYENEIHHFISSVESGKRPEPTIEDSVKTMRLLDELEGLLAGASMHP